MDERRLELKVGALILIALAGVVGLMYLLGELRLGGGKRVLIDFAHSGGVPNGAPVKLAGVRVGRIKELKLLPGRRDVDGSAIPVQLAAEIDESVFKELTGGATFVVATQGPLGEPFIEIEPGPPSKEHLVEGRAYRGVDPPRMDLLASRAYAFLDAATKVIAEDPDSIKAMIQAVARMSVKAEGVLEESRPVVTQAAHDLGDAAAQLKKLANDATAMLDKNGELNRVLRDAAVISAQVRRDLPPITNQAQKAIESAAHVAGSFSDEDIRDLKQAIDRYEKAGASLNEVAQRADRLLAKVENGEGSVGAAMKDPQLYEDLKALVTDLKRHPWKVFWKSE